MADIRLATPDDIPVLHALVESAYRGETSRAGWTTEADLLGGQRIDPAMLSEMLADPSQAILVAERPDGIIGCIAVAERANRTGYFGMLSVKPALQAAGVGRRLIDAAHRHMQQHYGAVRSRISVFPQRTTLIAWYERLGYRPTGETLPFAYGDLRFGEPLRDDLSFIVMERPLP
jgi:Acetyltransferases